jgi:hypothetical protein
VRKVNLASATKRREEFVKHGTESSRAVRTESHIPVDTAEKKKATFNMDRGLHKRLKQAAVTQERDMTELMEDAVREYLDRVELG